MKIRILFSAVGLVALAGCASTPEARMTAGGAAAPAPAPEKVDWSEVDKSTARMKERKNKAPAGKVTTTDEVERGFFAMSDDDYAAALASATEQVRKDNPKMSAAEIDTLARTRADEAKRKFENSYTTRASAGVKWSYP